MFPRRLSKHFKSASPSNGVKGKSVSPDVVGKPGKSFPPHGNHPSLASSQSHRLSVAWLSHPTSSPYLAPPSIPSRHKTGRSRDSEGLHPPACLAAAVVPRVTALHAVRLSHDRGKMAALTAENFAALQSLLKVNWEGGDGASGALVLQTLDGVGMGINGA